MAMAAGTRSTLTAYLLRRPSVLRTALLATKMQLVEEVTTVATITGKNLVILAQIIKAMIVRVLSVASISDNASMATCRQSIPVTLQINPHSPRYVPIKYLFKD